MVERNAVEFSLQDVARAIGPQLGAGQISFRQQKDGLLLAILERDAELSLKQVERLVARDIPAIDKLRAHVGHHRHLFPQALHEPARAHADPRARRRSSAQVSRFFVEPLAGFQRQILEQGREIRRVQTGRPGFFYHAVGSACDALFRWHPEARRIWGVATINDAQRRRYADFVVDLVLNGVVKRD